jgi:hypothetical protein
MPTSSTASWSALGEHATTCSCYSIRVVGETASAPSSPQALPAGLRGVRMRCPLLHALAPAGMCTCGQPATRLSCARRSLPQAPLTAHQGSTWRCAKTAGTATLSVAAHALYVGVDVLTHVAADSAAAAGPSFQERAIQQYSSETLQLSCHVPCMSAPASQAKPVCCTIVDAACLNAVPQLCVLRCWVRATCALLLLLLLFSCTPAVLDACGAFVYLAGPLWVFHRPHLHDAAAIQPTQHIPAHAAGGPVVHSCST